MQRLFTPPRVTFRCRDTRCCWSGVCRLRPPATTPIRSPGRCRTRHVRRHRQPQLRPDRGQFGAAQLLPVTEDEKVVTPADAKIKWQADLGSRAYGGPTVSGGRVFVGTNNERPRNPRDARKNADGDLEPVDMGILMAFDEKSRNFLWQAVHDKLPGGLVVDWPKEGVCSTPAVDGDRIYYVSNRCTVICAVVKAAPTASQRQADGVRRYRHQEDAGGYATPTDADFLWELDMIGDLGVFPHNMSRLQPADRRRHRLRRHRQRGRRGARQHSRPASPELHRHRQEHGQGTLDPQRPRHEDHARPVVEPVLRRHRRRPAGDLPRRRRLLRGYKPETGELLWQCDCNPKDSKYELGGTGTKNDFIGTPVVDGWPRLHRRRPGPRALLRRRPFLVHRPDEGQLRKGRTSRRTRRLERRPASQPESGLVWHYGGRDDAQVRPPRLRLRPDDVHRRGRGRHRLHRRVTRLLHCLDAKTGKKYWQYDIKGAIWGSTYYVDGKVLPGHRSRRPVRVQAHDDAEGDRRTRHPGRRERPRLQQETAGEAKRCRGRSTCWARQEFDAPIRCTLIVADGVHVRHDREHAVRVREEVRMFC